MASHPPELPRAHAPHLPTNILLLPIFGLKAHRDEQFGVRRLAGVYAVDAGRGVDARCVEVGGWAAFVLRWVGALGSEGEVEAVGQAEELRWGEGDTINLI